MSSNIMKNRTISIFFLFSTIFLYSQNINQEKNLLEIKKKDTIINTLKKELNQVQNKFNHIEHSGIIKVESLKDESTKDESLFKFIFPSLIAIFIGLISLYGTIISGKRQRNSSEKQFKEQLKNSQTTLDLQIKSSKETLEKQIESANKISELEFRQNVLSNNRQKWVNDLRDSICEIVALIDNNVIKESISSEDYKKINFLILKSELMVNPLDDKKFLEALHKVHLGLITASKNEIKISDFKILKKELMKETKGILKTEWEKVKKGM